MRKSIPGCVRRVSRGYFIVLIVVLICFLSPSRVAFSQGAGHLPILAVMNFEGPPEISLFTEAFVDRFTLEIAKDRAFDVADRGHITQVLEEIQFQQKYCSEVTCAVVVGKRLGAEKVIVGKVQKFGSTFYIVARLIDVATGKIEAIADVTCDNCERDVNMFLKSATVLANKLLTEMGGSPQPETGPAAPTHRGAPPSPASPQEIQMRKMRRTKNIGITTTIGGALLVPTGIVLLFRESIGCESYSQTYNSTTGQWEDTDRCTDYEYPSPAPGIVTIVAGGAGLVVGPIMWGVGQSRLNKARKEGGRITEYDGFEDDSWMDRFSLSIIPSDNMTWFIWEYRF